MFSLTQRRYFALFSFASLALVYTSATITQAKEPGNPPAGKMKKIDVKGDFYEYVTKPEGVLQKLQGNARFKFENTILTTDLALYNEKTGVANSPGKLKVDEPDNTLTGNTGTAYYKTRDVKIRDSVVIEIRPRAKDRNAAKGSSRSNFKEPVVINCQKVDYNWRTKVAEMTGDLVFKQKERTVTAERAVYDGKTETLTLFQNVEYKSVKGDIGHGDKAIAILSDGNEKFTVTNVNKTEFYFEDEEEKETPAKPQPTGAASSVPANPATPATSPASPPATQPANTPAPATPPTTPPPTPGNIPGNPPANAPAGGGRL